MLDVRHIEDHVHLSKEGWCHIIFLGMSLEHTVKGKPGLLVSASALRMGSQIRKHSQKSVLQSSCVYSVGYRRTQLLQSRLVEVSDV